MLETERFWKKVSVGDTADCWIWQGAQGKDHYGRFSVGGRKGQMHLAHRVAWELSVGPIPTGMILLHSCDNPPCVNPAHLKPGTQTDNMRDMALKGRSGRLKLSDDMVREIRSLCASGARQRDVAEQFGVSQSNISFIIRRETRGHVQDALEA